MARAHRHYIPGCIWHITHRCHQKEFLLKFSQDRSRFVDWLREAHKRFGFEILNYTVTSNHVHLLVKDSGHAGCIPSAMQLVAGRTAQEYNQRKGRKGAFWEDRYHATAIESGDHLRRCLVYLDMNMVRAGVVQHPEEWVHGGYLEIQGKRRRNRILSLDALAEAVGVVHCEELKTAHREWVEEALNDRARQRQDIWTKSIAVGSAEFVLKTQRMLGAKGKGRAVVRAGESFELREAQDIYGGDFGPGNRAIASDNSYFWE